MAEDNLIFQADEEKVSQDIQKLDELAAQSERVLYNIKSVFPFQFFPDELILDESKVSLITNTFFASSQVRSLPYKNIFNVIVEYSIFFAKLKIVENGFFDQPLEIEYLNRNKAMRARRLIQGLIIVKKDEDIDLSKLKDSEILERIEILGKARE